METFYNQLRTRILLQLTLVIWIAALLIPASRALLLQQGKMLVFTPTGVVWTLRQAGMRVNLPDSDPTDEQAALASVMRLYRRDYLIQTAFALRSDALQKPNQEDERVKRLRLLLPAFPSNPGLYAHILRLETARDIGIRRDTEYETFMNGRASPYTATADSQPATADALTDFDHDAAVGEQLDPSNAYFPMMRAIGLFAARRDDEALAALRRAVRKPKWNDYTPEETEAVWRLAKLAFGERSAALHTALHASTPLPHLKELRNTARMIVYKAAQREKAGKLEEGIALRQIGIECGALVRTFSTAPLGGYYGAEMVEIAVAAARRRARRSRCPAICPRSRKISFAAMPSSLSSSRADMTPRPVAPRREFDASHRARAILDKSVEPEFVPPTRQAKNLTSWWIAGNAAARQRHRDVSAGHRGGGAGPPQAPYGAPAQRQARQSFYSRDRGRDHAAGAAGRGRADRSGAAVSAACAACCTPSPTRAAIPIRRRAFWSRPAPSRRPAPMQIAAVLLSIAVPRPADGRAGPLQLSTRTGVGGHPAAQSAGNQRVLALTPAAALSGLQSS